jgi:hypothetical protein
MQVTTLGLAYLRAVPPLFCGSESISQSSRHKALRTRESRRSSVQLYFTQLVFLDGRALMLGYAHFLKSGAD